MVGGIGRQENDTHTHIYLSHLNVLSFRFQSHLRTFLNFIPYAKFRTIFNYIYTKEEQVKQSLLHIFS